ncbi:hypothetical protein [Paenibacillus piscarius]|uniref:hypothetical protein n=1 Tax=Paenibacillus piscarius TaxID=1089681 RepID=UPI001EE7DC28|nr:hypothetical protein [Paenibacillus piscarius]
MTKNSNLMSGFIGTVIGACIGVGATCLGVYLNLSFDFMVDNEAALLELNNVKSILESTKIGEIPKYKLLNNIDVDWKTVLIDIGDEELRNLYYELATLDTLLERIHQTVDGPIRKEYIMEYGDRINFLAENNLVDREIENVTRKNNSSY